MVSGMTYNGKLERMKLEEQHQKLDQHINERIAEVGEYMQPIDDQMYQQLSKAKKELYMKAHFPPPINVEPMTATEPLTAEQLQETIDEIKELEPMLEHHKQLEKMIQESYKLQQLPEEVLNAPKKTVPYHHLYYGVRLTHPSIPIARIDIT